MLTVVTGASGHLGGVLVRALLDRGVRVRALYRRDERALEGLACERIPVDVCDAEAMKRALEGGHTLFHLAALISITGGQRGEVERVNIRGVESVMECALEAGVTRVVHASSVHAFDLVPGRDGERTVDERSERPKRGKQGAYDLSKAAGEAAVRRAIERGLDAVIVNPSGVIGPYDFKPSRMGRVFIKLFRRKLPATVAGGFDFVDVRDVVDGMLAAAERGRTGENYILSGRWCSVRELARMAESVSGVRAPRMDTPMALARLGAPFATLFSRAFGREPLYTGESLVALRSVRDISHHKATRELDYRPRPTEETIADLYAWLQDHGMLGHAGEEP